MDKENSMGPLPMMHPAAIVELMTEVWGLLTEEQKKKVMKMRIDIINQLMAAEVSNEEKINEIKKKAIAYHQEIQEMLK
jgi:tetrahydromethanopterin S-methyltransferase subunit C